MKRTQIGRALVLGRSRTVKERAVITYGLEILDALPTDDIPDGLTRAELNQFMLNGQGTWVNYSYSVVPYSNAEIAARVCTPSELKRCNGGKWWPAREETWRGLQGLFLRKAFTAIANSYELITNTRG